VITYGDYNSFIIHASVATFRLIERFGHLAVPSIQTKAWLFTAHYWLITAHLSELKLMQSMRGTFYTRTLSIFPPTVQRRPFD
jgi:hypothetical protein